MKKQLLRFTLYAIIIYLTCGALNPAIAASHPLGGSVTHFCGVIDGQWDKQHSDQYPNRHYARTSAANLSVGEPRTVRMIYFLPNDRPYRAGIVQKMKDEIFSIQAFYAEGMQAHGYRNTTFRVETNPQGEPIVHRVDGQHLNSYYLENTDSKVRDEIEIMFDIETNIYHTIIDYSMNDIGRAQGDRHGASGSLPYIWKAGGYILHPANKFDFVTIAHTLGHAFGLHHDFSDSAYIMSYGPGLNRLSARLSSCHAEFLSVHPYFNFNTPIEVNPSPSIELISPRGYSTGTKRVPVRLKVSDLDGLHQVLLFVYTREPHSAAGNKELKTCHGLSGKKEAVIEFNYDGVIPSDDLTSLSQPVVHPIRIIAADVNWNVKRRSFELFSEKLQPLSKISGDNQHSFADASLPNPFVVEVWDVNSGRRQRGVHITFTVTAGDGTLSVEQIQTDYNGRAASTLTLGPNIGTNTVEVSASGISERVTFNAVAGGRVDLPDSHLRAVIEPIIGKTPDEPIAPADMMNLTRLTARAQEIHDLTGLEFATNLERLELERNNLSNVSALAGLNHLRRLLLAGNRVSDLEPLTNLIRLEQLDLDNNSVSDISILAELIRLTSLYLQNNKISNISIIAGMTRLRFLYLNNNSVSNIEPLSGLTRLTELRLDRNSISDITALSGLHQLTELRLDRNNITDLSPLVANTGLGNGDTVDVRRNPLSYLSIHTHIPALQNRGVTIEFDNVVTKPVDIPDPNLRDAIALVLDKVSGESITTTEMLDLFDLEAGDANISNLTGLKHATNLKAAFLERNSISDISPMADLIQLTKLRLGGNSISNISPLSGLTQLTRLSLWANSISGISPVKALTNLTELNLSGNSISSIASVAGLTQLTWLHLQSNSISDIAALAGLTNLTALRLDRNSISDIAALSGLHQLTELRLDRNNITDLSPLVANTGLRNGDTVEVRGNPLSYLSVHTHIPALQSRGVTVEFDNQAHPALLKISGDSQKGAAFAPLSQPFLVEAQDANGSALVGISATFAVTAGGGTLSTTSTRTDLNGRAQSTLILGPNLGTNTVSVSAAGIEGVVTFNAISDTLPTEFLLSIPRGINLIHVPLKVTAVNDVPQTIESVADLYDVLGGEANVIYLVTRDSQTQQWINYLSSSDRSTPKDRELTDDMGIIANLITPVLVHLSGSPLGTNGNSTITLNPGINLVGLPLRDSGLTHVSDLFALAGIAGNVRAVMLIDNGKPKQIQPTSDAGTIPIIGGQGFILTAQQAATVAISGEGWYNHSPTLVAPVVGNADLHSHLTGIHVTDTAPVLALKGSIVFPERGWGKIPTYGWEQHLVSGARCPVYG